MAPKGGGGGAGAKKLNNTFDGQQSQSSTTTIAPSTKKTTTTTMTPKTTTNTQRAGLVGSTPKPKNNSQQPFSIAPLVLEGAKLTKMALNDFLKQQFSDIKITDIQLGRSGNFTLYAYDVKSFNRLLNDLTTTLAANGQTDVKVYVPRSIQRIKDTEKMAFVKRVDLEIPDDRIRAALTAVGLDVTNVIRLTSKDGKTPTRTIKISFNDVQNRNTFVHTGLQVDCMHFTAEPASQNNKPVQCYICLQYNHVAKYCKTKQQVCAKCGENHKSDQCSVANDAAKCHNCKGNHLATSDDCPVFKDQEKRMLNLVNQYATAIKPTTMVPALHDINHFPPLPNVFQQRQDSFQNDLFDQMFNAFSSKMEKLIEETTSRLFRKLQTKIKYIEKSIGLYGKGQDDASTDSDSDSQEESQVVKHIKASQQKKQLPTTDSSITTSSKVNTASNIPPPKQLRTQEQIEANNTHKRLLNETNLKSERQFSLWGYNIFRNDRVGKSGGGVLLAIKRHIKCREVYNKTAQENEVIAVEIETKGFNSILISSIYVPPKAKINKSIFDDLYSINNNCIIVGDFNATSQEKGSSKTNSKGRQLQELYKEGLIDCVDDDYTTFERPDYEEKLDWILASQPLLSFITNVETHPLFGIASTGHKPLTFDIPLRVEVKLPSPRISFNFNAAKWPLFRSKLDQQLMQWNMDRRLNSTLDLEEYTTFITKSILAATQEAIPRIKQKITSYSPSEASKNLIQLKHQAYRRWKKTGDDIDKHQFYTSKVLLTNSLRNDRRNNFNKLMSSLCQKKMYSDAVWRTVRKFHNKRIKQTYANVMKYNSTTATSDKEKADLFADFFQNEVYFEATDSLPFHNQVTRRTGFIRKGMATNSNTTKWKLITVNEVKYHLKQLRNSATGSDNIHNRCLKNYSKLLVQHLTNLYNAVLNQGYIPNTWKQANIILLLKPKKDKQQPSSYRPISLLSCLGKLLEKIVKQRLMSELDRRNILPEHQAGFRPGKSTVYNIVRLQQYAERQLTAESSRRHSAVVLFDIKAAFDSFLIIWPIKSSQFSRTSRFISSFAHTLQMKRTLES
ncbi:unnamed protein product [Adineta ricciae]|uniref:Reverse transcriptase domain-containing protein n=1 Tax=Adineta ricciae TaxID=249248 RepID=A0A813U670_ADIRI|nr:unnamed protein product [Adineta ricciae]